MYHRKFIDLHYFSLQKLTINFIIQAILKCFNYFVEHNQILSCNERNGASNGTAKPRQVQGTRHRVPAQTGQCITVLISRNDPVAIGRDV